MNKNYVLEVNGSFQIKKGDAVVISKYDLDIVDGIVAAVLEQGVLVREMMALTAKYVEYQSIAVLNDATCEEDSFVLKEGE